MRDGEVGAAIAEGDPGGLAEAYDRYASALYTYCRWMLREPADAADAVQDTFVIAASELAGLRDPHRLRPWLYAVARNECLRRTGGAAAREAAVLDTVPEVTGAWADVSGEDERAELGALLRSAVRGLGAGEQDLIQLRWQHGLDVAEIAAILGVSRNRAHALLSHARDQLETALGVLLVARTGGEACAALSTLLEDAEGQLTVPMKNRIDRHIRRCRVCAERRRRELAPALLLGLAPLAWLPVAAMPARMRARVLRLANSNTPGAVAYRANVARRTAPFRNHGFPKPIDPPGRQWRPSRQRQAAAAAGVAIAAAVAAATLLTLALAGGGSGRHDTAALAKPVPSTAAGTSTGAGASQEVPGSARPTRSGNASPAAAAGGARPTASPLAGGPAAGPRPSATRPASGPGSPAPSARSATATATSRARVTAAPRPAQGTLTVAPTSIAPLPGRSATLTLTAANGPVDWSITPSQSLTGDVTIVPSSGTLAAGESATVTVTASDLVTASGQLIVEPGGITVTVVLDW
jgi:RNA polymerase sigma factor (sigma-70 family)